MKAPSKRQQSEPFFAPASLQMARCAGRLSTVEMRGFMALIKVKDSRSTADFLVYEVDSRSAADLLVCVTESRSPARGKDELWCFVESASAADSKICFVDSKGVADLLICYVDSRSVAGWKKDHELKGRIA